MSLDDPHAIETYKSLISISTEAFKALQYLNGGAVIALLSYFANKTPIAPKLLSTVTYSLSYFTFGLLTGTLVYASSYMTQFALHNENKGLKFRWGKHQTWLFISLFLCISSIVFFGLGAFEFIGSLS